MISTSGFLQKKFRNEAKFQYLEVQKRTNPPKYPETFIFSYLTRKRPSACVFFFFIASHVYFKRERFVLLIENTIVIFFAECLAAYTRCISRSKINLNNKLIQRAAM